MRPRKPLLIAATAAALLVTLLAWRIISNTRASRMHDADRPLAVDTVTARVQPMPLLLQAVGQVQPERTVQVRPQVPGMLKEVLFSEGQYVTAGQRLFQIDPAPFEAALNSAKAAAENAQANADRLAPLAKQDYVTPQEYDNARAAADQARAAYQPAEINLSYADIRAPLTGRTGSLAVKAGNLVAPTDATPLVVINQMKPILVQYTVPQQMLEAVRRYQSRQSIKVFVTHEDGGDPLGQGQLVFVDNAVNPDTGTVLLKARLPNDGEQLWPGEYVGVRMQLALQTDALVLPQTAIQTGQDGVFVYLVRDGTAEIQPVKVDRQVDDWAVIASGLKPGDTVVAHVPRNLRPGLPVETSAAEKPASTPAARP